AAAPLARVFRGVAPAARALQDARSARWLAERDARFSARAVPAAPPARAFPAVHFARVARAVPARALQFSRARRIDQHRVRRKPQPSVSPSRSACRDSPTTIGCDRRARDALAGLESASPIDAYRAEQCALAPWAVSKSHSDRH